MTVKKNVLKILIILSLTGNVAALLFFNGPSDLLNPEQESGASVGAREKTDSPKRDWVELREALREQQRRDRQTIEQLKGELERAKRGLNQEESGQRENAPKTTVNQGQVRALTATAAKAGVKKVLLDIPIKDADGNEIDNANDAVAGKFLRNILPFLSQKEAALESILEILGDPEKQGYHELALDLLRYTAELTGTDEAFDLKVLDLLNNNDLNVEIRAELVSDIGFSRYLEDPVFADKLLRLADNAEEALRVSILYSLDDFETDNVSSALERIAFNTAEDPHVRQAALRSLSSSKDYTRDMMDLMSHENNALRAAAVQKLSEQRAVPGLLERIHKLAKSEQDPGVLWSMVNYIGDGGNLNSIPILREIENRTTLPADLRDYAKSHRLDYEREAEELKRGSKSD